MIVKLTKLIHFIIKLIGNKETTCPMCGNVDGKLCDTSQGSETITFYCEKCGTVL